jgi:hypothetical protein
MLSTLTSENVEGPLARWPAVQNRGSKPPLHTNGIVSVDLPPNFSGWVSSRVALDELIVVDYKTNVLEASLFLSL